MNADPSILKEIQEDEEKCFEINEQIEKANDKQYNLAQEQKTQTKENFKRYFSQTGKDPGLDDESFPEVEKKRNENTKDFITLKDPHASSLSFRDKKLSKLTKSVLESNYSTRISEIDGQHKDSYINCSKTPNITFKKQNNNDMDLLVNPSKGFIVEDHPQFKLVNEVNNNFLEEKLVSQGIKAKISNFKLVSDSEDSKDNFENYKGIAVNNEIAEDEHKNNSRDINAKRTDSGLGYRDNDADYIAEESNRVIERKMKILFTIYISTGLIQQVIGETNENSPAPIVIKELMTVMSTENFLTIIKRFISIINCHLEVHNLRLLDLNDAARLINGEQTKLEDQTAYLAKYMKTSGKPDYELPGFDLKRPIDKFKIDKFALGFEPRCLTSIKGKTSSKFKSTINKPIIDYISETDSDDESSSTGNTIKNNISQINNHSQYDLIGNDAVIDLNNRKAFAGAISKDNKMSSNEETKKNESAENGAKGNPSEAITSINNNNKGCCDSCIVF